MPKRDVAVVGGGPNGLAAAITLARAGRSVVLFEADQTVGGGCRSAELTLPGFTHDVCSAIHPLGVASPLFRSVPLERLGVEWINPPLALAHPFDDGTAAVLSRSFDETGESLGRDATAYEKIIKPFHRKLDALLVQLLGPLARLPKHPLLMARFALSGFRSARGLASSEFDGPRARALFCGMAAHSMLPLERRITASFGIMFAAVGHAFGWPFPKGGSQRLADALSTHLIELGGEVVTGSPVENVAQLDDASVKIFDLTPRQILDIAGDRFPERYERALKRFRYGPGVFKVDWALDAPVPWKASECALAGTVHIGGTMEEIAESESGVWKGKPSEKPFTILAQQSLFDPSRAPHGKHTLWGYCHVPAGSPVDMTEAIEDQIERFAPGFKDTIIAKSAMGPSELETYNANYIGGDINGGVQDVRQLFARPVVRLDPYSTPAKDIFICSSSTPPGGGVHGMCGYHSARSVLKKSPKPG